MQRIGKIVFLVCLLLLCVSTSTEGRIRESSRDLSSQSGEQRKESNAERSDPEQQQSKGNAGAKLEQEQTDALSTQPAPSTGDGTEDSASIAENIDSSTEDSAPTARDSVPPTEDSTLSTKDSAPSTKDNTPLTKDSAQTTGDNVPPTDYSTLSTEDSALSTNDKDTLREASSSNSEQQPTQDSLKSAAHDNTEQSRVNSKEEDSRDGADEQKETPDTSEPEDDKFKEGMKLISSLEYPSKIRGYEYLRSAAEAGNQKAKAAIAYGYLYGNALKRNYTKAFELFSWLADRGMPAGQAGLGFMYSTGIRVNSSQAKAILYYTFAALGGDPFAMMAMAYRSRLGVGTPLSCESALSYYHKVATEVSKGVSVFTGGFAVQKARLSDGEDGGSPVVFGGVSEDEVEHYSEVFADTGSNVQISLGLYYMFGLGGTDRNLVKALAYLKRAASDDYATASAFIGRIYAEGSPPEIPQSNDTALKYFIKSAKLESIEGYIGLGMMYFYGMGVEKNYEVAWEHLFKASGKGSPEAHYYVGLMLSNGLGVQRSVGKAISHFKAAAQAGHVLAIYELGEANARGTTGHPNCDQAVELLKAVSERGRWSRLLREAYRTYYSGDVNTALMMYLLLGEMGYEIAQSNAAYILEEGNSDMLDDRNDTLKRALLLWGRSASQGYATARVKLGDYYYYGHGADQDLELAAEQYRLASDRMGSPQAMFNLGYMYEQGIGLERDYHLAKRYYDMAAETSREASLPVNLALIKLTLTQYYTDLLKYLRGESTSNTDETLLPEPETATATDKTSELSDFEENWDIYLTALLCVLLVIVIRWRRR